MNYIVSVFLNEEILDQIGKKGTENSITFYNGTFNGNVIVAITPSDIEEKFYAVAEAMLISEQMVIGTHSIDSLFGELLVASSLLGKRVILSNETNVDEMVKSIGVKIEYSDTASINQKIIELQKNVQTEKCRVDIDKSFLVNGIGTVTLGVVTKGIVKVHDKLFANSGIEVTVKSIQSRDVDVEQAVEGTRVGLALKGAKSDDIKKGDLFSKSAIPSCKSLSAHLTYAQINKEEIKSGSTYGFVSNFSYTNCSVSSISGNEITLKLERPLQLEEEDKFLLLRENKPRIFASGIIEKVL